MNRLYLLLLLLLLAISLPAFPQAFTYKAIDIPGAMETQVRGVNSSGEIVGFYKTTSCVDFNIQFPNCPVHGFKITNGVLTKLLVPHSTWTDIMGVNDFGDLVGFAITSDTGAHAFLWTHKNVITYFNTPEGGTNSDVHPVAMSVNKALIVGGSDWFFGNMAPNGGWVWANGKFGIMNPGDSSGGCCPDGEGVNGISNNGFLSGQNSDQGHVTAWFKSGHDEDFYPLDSDVVGTGVNNNADVIGFSVDGKGFFAKHIELNEGANDAVEVKPSFIPVSFPGAKATYPFGLSDKRMIGGTYVDSNGGVHGFIATPNF